MSHKITRVRVELDIDLPGELSLDAVEQNLETMLPRMIETTERVTLKDWWNVQTLTVQVDQDQKAL